MSQRAVIYTRVSKDRDKDTNDEGKAVERQLEDSEKLAKNRGYEVVAVYSDNDISAAGTAKERAEYNEMLAQARLGAFDVIVAYSNSRLTRRPAEWMELIQLANTGKIEIATVASGQHDLTTADGRAVALTIAVWDAAEAERVGERVSRAARQRAANGLPQKGRHRLYGYNGDWTVNEGEAEIIREAFERRATGESTTAICKDFTKRGIKTVAGNDWKSGTLCATLTKPVYCGLIAYRGEIIADSTVPALVDKPLFDAAQRNLANNKKGTNARKYLLSGILLCGHCLTAMKGNPSGLYRCSTTYGGCGRLSVSIENADPYVMHAAFAKYVAQVGNRRTHSVIDYTSQIEDLQREREKLQEGYKNDVYTLKEVQPLLADVRQRIKELEKKQAVQRPAVPLIQKKYMEYFKGNLSQRRVFIGEHIDNVVVHPLAKPGRKFDPSRLEAHYTDGTKERLELYEEHEPE